MGSWRHRKTHQMLTAYPLPLLHHQLLLYQSQQRRKAPQSQHHQQQMTHHLVWRPTDASNEWPASRCAALLPALSVACPKRNASASVPTPCSSPFLLSNTTQSLVSRSRMYSFQCASANYFHAERDCVLNLDSRHSAPEQFGPERAEQEVTYLGLLCSAERHLQQQESLLSACVSPGLSSSSPSPSPSRPIAEGRHFPWPFPNVLYRIGKFGCPLVGCLLPGATRLCAGGHGLGRGKSRRRGPMQMFMRPCRATARHELPKRTILCRVGNLPAEQTKSGIRP